MQQGTWRAAGAVLGHLVSRYLDLHICILFYILIMSSKLYEILYNYLNRMRTPRCTKYFPLQLPAESVPHGSRDWGQEDQTIEEHPNEQISHSYC